MRHALFRSTLRVLMACVVLWSAGPARASGDYECVPAVVPANADYGYGCAGTAVLAPGNDTRINLVLLMTDRHGGAPKVSPPKLEPLQRPVLRLPFSWESFAGSLVPAGKADEDDGGTLLSGEGTVCVSNAAGEAAFVAALEADRGVAAEERIRLAAARRLALCPVGGEPAATLDPALSQDVRSASGRQFLAYLQAAAAFYAGDHDPASFVALSKQKKQPWVREAASYMIGRTWALQAQDDGFGAYGEIAFDRMDRTALAKAEAALQTYLHDYPRGAWTASAQGLLRRVYWLGQDNDRLAAAYRAQIDQRDARLRNLPDTDLAQEIDAKLPLEAYRLEAAGPVLLAVDDLRRMRRSADDATGKAGITREELTGQRARFASVPGLHDYLLAAYAFFVERAPKRVLDGVPAATPGEALDAVAFSRQALRALALDALDDPQAREALVALFPHATGPYQHQTLELALAMHDERHGHLDRVFAKGSPVVDAEFRERLLRNVAGPDLLRARMDDAMAPPRERAIARYILLYKSLTRGRYAEFLRDAKGAIPAQDADPDRYFKLERQPPLGEFGWAGSTDGYRCPSLPEIAGTLQRYANDVHASLCLAEFVRRNGYDHFELDTQQPADELGGSATQFPGKPFSRQTIYQRAIADATASPQDRAYALYRAVNCYAPSGANDCGGEDVPVATRKGWFRRLKSEFPTSPWARSLQYYW